MDMSPSEKASNMLIERLMAVSSSQTLDAKKYIVIHKNPTVAAYQHITGTIPDELIVGMQYHNIIFSIESELALRMRKKAKDRYTTKSLRLMRNHVYSVINSISTRNTKHAENMTCNINIATMCEYLEQPHDEIPYLIWQAFVAGYVSHGLAKVSGNLIMIVKPWI